MSETDNPAIPDPRITLSGQNNYRPNFTVHHGNKTIFRYDSFLESIAFPKPKGIPKSIILNLAGRPLTALVDLGKYLVNPDVEITMVLEGDGHLHIKTEDPPIPIWKYVRI